uniref:Nucleoporin Nup133/Nup155-like N-terminal domain-containing protein n=1 Tax=Ditylenchus dipsaci TaxID=166011 RepID=A0A915EVI3_9BILA
MDNVVKYVKLDQEKIDLLYKLKIDDPYRTQGRIPTSGMSEGDYPSPDALGVSIFPRVWHHSFPQELKDQFKHIQSNFATGLLPTISRAWMAIDSDLFLWNFEANRDLAYYDGISNTILAVDVVMPKAGFTMPDMHCILVVVTTCDVVLLAISFRDEAGKSFAPNFKDFKNSDTYLLGDPIFKVHLEGVIVSHVCCTNNGRIFFGAEDNLYEIEYYGKSWFGGKSCKKVNHSKSLLNYIVPMLSIFHSKDEIRQIEIDDTRHILYVLTIKGTIQIFDLGTDGKSVSRFGAVSRDQIESWALQACSVTPEFFKKLLASQLFLSLEAPVEYTQDHMRPTVIKIIHVRFPPNDLNFNIYSAYYSKDTVLMGSGHNMETSLWSLSSSNYPFCSRLIENGAELPIRGNIWKIAKGVDHCVCKQQDPFVLPSIELPLVAEQHNISFEKFFILTSEVAFSSFFGTI